MNTVDPSRNEIAPNALWAIEALEEEREPGGLGPAFAAAERESRRLGSFWRLEFILTVLWGLAVMLTLAVPSDATQTFRLIGVAILVALAIVRLVLSRSSARIAALTRVNNALDRWRFLVPAMRELPK